MSDDEGWQSPGFNNRDDSRNPYAPQPEANEQKEKQPEEGKDRHPGEDNY
jgi:cell division protease FtsH